VATQQDVTPTPVGDYTQQNHDDPEERFVEASTSLSSRQCKRRRLRDDVDILSRSTVSRCLQTAPDGNAAFARFRLRDVRDSVLARASATKQPVANDVLQRGCQCQPADPLLEELDRIENGLVSDVDHAIEKILAQLATSCSWCVAQAGCSDQPCTGIEEGNDNRDTTKRRCFERTTNRYESIQRPTKAARTDRELPQKLVSQSIASLLR
jgi:hypothetical protein